MSGLSVVERLDLNIYGIDIEIGFACKSDKREVARLLHPFARKPKPSGGAGFRFNYLKRERPQEVAVFLLPALAEAGVWAVHAGGFEYKGGHLVVGSSGSGKSTFACMALENGFPVLGDDIILLRESEGGIELLPFFSAIYTRDEEIPLPFVDLPPVFLAYLVFPEMSAGPVSVQRVGKKAEVLRKLSSCFLWAADGQTRKRQKRFVERLVHFSAFDVSWHRGIFGERSIFMEIVDEIVQG